MAKAKFIPEVQTITTTPEHVVLELTLEEASVIFDLVGLVTGNPDHSRRGLTNKIYDALYIIPSVRESHNKSDIDDDSRVYFKPVYKN